MQNKALKGAFWKCASSWFKEFNSQQMLEKIASSLWHSLTPFISKSYISTNWHGDLVEFATHLSLVFTNDAFSALAEIRV